jgi:hypothetical protein
LDRTWHSAESIELKFGVQAFGGIIVLYPAPNRDLKEYHYVVFISAWFGNLCRTDINIGKDRN